eukprot:GILI01002416.1.p1 GENE.GILI01002416.1~~GILI01002416.1.p1  ORF type:complete len:178 (+),score=26.31 GILI01002416.1:78-536(+)
MDDMFNGYSRCTLVGNWYEERLVDTDLPDLQANRTEELNQSRRKPNESTPGNIADYGFREMNTTHNAEYMGVPVSAEAERPGSCVRLLISPPSAAPASSSTSSSTPTSHEMSGYVVVQQSCYSSPAIVEVIRTRWAQVGVTWPEAPAPPRID